MPEFAWRAADASGRVTEGRIEAATQVIAARHLRADLDRRYVPGEGEAAVRVPTPPRGTQGAGGSIVGG